MTHASKISIPALFLVVAAIAAPSASARPVEDPSLPLSAPQADAYTPAVVVEPASSSSSSTEAGGFDWGDAAIGGAAAFALTMIGLGGMLAASHRRHRPANRTAIV